MEGVIIACDEVEDEARTGGTTGWIWTVESDGLYASQHASD